MFPAEDYLPGAGKFGFLKMSEVWNKNGSFQRPFHEGCAEFPAQEFFFCKNDAFVKDPEDGDPREGEPPDLGEKEESKDPRDRSH
jgi:hypothetical protein